MCSFNYCYLIYPYFSCDKDETIRHYTNGMSRVQRFSMQAFRFMSQHRFVYLHCDLVVCYAYDYNSTCARSTTCQQRYRRDVGQSSEDVSGMYPLSFGPIMYEKGSTEKNSNGMAVRRFHDKSTTYFYSVSPKECHSNEN